MAFKEEYISVVRVLLQVLPFLEEFPDFALKGGTAINLFYRDLPRLSVDIDLTYLPVKDRAESIETINSMLRELKVLIESRLKLKVTDSFTPRENLGKLVVQIPGKGLKIEPNFVLRGSCFPPEKRELSPAAAEQFRLEVDVLCLSFEDTYGGKLCAALSRQHPRDLFDVKLLLENEGLGNKLRKAFLVYLIQANRPIAEILQPNPIDIGASYRAEFVGMAEGAELECLQAIQSSLPGQILTALTAEEKAFLLSFKRGAPDWDKLGIGDKSNLPGVQWKLQNLARMAPAKKNAALSGLENLLS
jgi:predicted nucleotidyltransferase component of viral defense system